MNTTQTFIVNRRNVNYGRSFEKLSIIEALAAIPNKSCFAAKIIECTQDAQEHSILIETLREQGLDCEAVIVNIIGQQTWDMILRYEP